MRTMGTLLFIFLFGLVMVTGAIAQTTPFSPGEKITYDIKKFGIRMGGAELVYNGPVSYAGKEALLLTFTSHSLNFFDEEKIYMEPNTFFPIAVERDLNIFGKKEQIIELYQSDKGVVSLTKKVDGIVSTEEIKKTGKLDNIYCFIYRFRLSGKFQEGEKIEINLPTKDVDVKIKNKTKIKAAGQTYDAFYMETDPSQFSVWFEDGDKKIPLRIDGAVGVQKAVMIMTDFKTK